MSNKNELAPGMDRVTQAKEAPKATAHSVSVFKPSTGPVGNQTPDFTTCVFFSANRSFRSG